VVKRLFKSLRRRVKKDGKRADTLLREEESVAHRPNHAGESGTILVVLLSAKREYQWNAKSYPQKYPPGI
jgi:hypothetical protein